MFEARRWLTFLWMNVVAALLAAGVFLFVLWADFLDGGARAVVGWLNRHPGWASWAAAAPLVVTMAIGVHYIRKGIRRRRAAAARGETLPRQHCTFTDEP